MNGEAQHPVPRRRGPGALLLMVLAGLLVLLAGLSASLVLPMITVLTATGERGGASWPVYVWVPFVFLASVWLVVRGIQAMDDPRPGRIALLAGIALVSFFSFPLFWLPVS